MDWPWLCISLTALILLLYALPALSSSPKSVLARGSKLSVEKRAVDVLVSSDGTFSCGFHQVGDNSFTFSIWFTPSNFTQNQNDPFPSPPRADIVWSANRDRPVNGHRSSVSLQGSNQFLVLTDGYDDSVVWSAATTSISGGQEQPNTLAEAETAELLDSGNLVVRDAGGSVLWQSFHFPTDTILPGQPLTRSTRLESSVSTTSMSSGSYAFYFDNDNVLRLMYDGPDISSIYWPNPDFSPLDNGRTAYNSSRYAVLNHAGRFVSSDRLSFNASDHKLPVDVVHRRLTLDPDGNLRLYSRRRDNRSDEKIKNGWYVTWQAIMDECKIHGQCGRNGICTYGVEPTCSCPPGYRKANPASWKDGCHPIFITPSGTGGINYFCNNNNNGSNSAFQFVKVGHADFYGSDIVVKRTLSIDDCRSMCEQDCNCQAFVYRPGQVFCYLKAALFNGYTSPEFPSSLFIKLPKNISVSIPRTTYLVNPNLTAPGESQFCSPNATTVTPIFAGGRSRSTSKFKWAYMYSFVGAFFLVEVMFIAVGSWFLYGRGEPSNSMVYSLEPAGQGGGYHYNHVMSTHFRMFSYHEIKRATNNFKHLLGRGGSGEVYKGVLDDKRVVAVKRLLDAEKGARGDEEFRAELSVIGRIYHMNLVRMWGFCMQSSRRILIYEYIENGSLDKVLFRPLSDDYHNITSTETDSDNDPTNSIASSHNLVSQQNVLSWSKRFGIALGMARGLAYLHHECLEWVIHCDIKPENILLDASYQPKIADFGLVKLTQRDSPGSHLSKVRGTKGYMAPEWTSNVPITTKVDVYSYGIILLELITGARISDVGAICQKLSPYHRHMSGNQLELRCLAKFLEGRLVNAKNERVKEGQPTSFTVFLEELVDPKLHGNFNGMQAQVMLEIALICIEEDRNKRPTMESVVQMLLNCCESEHENNDSD